MHIEEISPARQAPSVLIKKNRRCCYADSVRLIGQKFVLVNLFIIDCDDTAVPRYPDTGMCINNDSRRRIGGK